MFAPCVFQFSSVFIRVAEPGGRTVRRRAGADHLLGLQGLGYLSVVNVVRCATV